MNSEKSFSFQDLKKYHFYYLFAFPALSAPENVTVISGSKKILNHFSDEQVYTVNKLIIAPGVLHFYGGGYYVT